MKNTKKLIVMMLILTIVASVLSLGVASAATDVAYETIDFARLNGLSSFQATYNTEDRTITTQTANSCFIMKDTEVLNTEVVSYINFQQTGETRFVMRAQDTIAGGTYGRNGYSVHWYAHGAYNLYKQTSLGIGEESLLANVGGWGGPIQEVGKDMKVSFKTVNTEEGAVHIVFKVNDTVVFDYLDETDPILTAGRFGMFNTSAALFTLKGYKDNAYKKLAINEISGKLSQYGASFDANKNVNVSLTNGAFVLGQTLTDAEVSATLNFTTPGAITIMMRAQDTVGAQTYVRNGYKVLWYAHGAYELSRDSASLASLPGGAGPTIETGKDYLVKFKTVNREDGSVHITFSVNGQQLFNYYDYDANKLESGYFGIFSEGASFTATGVAESEIPTVSLFESSAPQNINSSTNVHNQDGSVTLNANNAHANSGVAFPLNYAGDKFGYTVNVNPINGGGFGPFDMRFTIGSVKPANTDGIPSPWYEGTGGWTTAGYIVHWYAWDGSIYVTRGSTDLWSVPTTAIASGVNTAMSVGTNTTYKIDLSLEERDDGSTKLVFKIDGVTKLVFVDYPNASTGYTPVTIPDFNQDNPTQANATQWAQVFSSPQAILNLSSVNAETDIVEKTTISKDLGNADIVSGNATMDANGVVKSFESSVIKYPTLIKNTAVKFNANFSAIGNSITLRLNENDDGGVNAKIYANGTVELYKGTQKLFSTISSVVLSQTNVDYEFYFATRNISSEKAQEIILNINGQSVLSYIDSQDLIKNAGSFVFESDGYAGALNQIGYDIPVVKVESGLYNGKGLVGRQLVLGSENTLGASNVEYVVESSSTAGYTQNANVLTLTSEGVIKVHVYANDLYSQTIEIEVGLPELIFTNLPTEKVVAGNTVNLALAMSDGRAIVSKTFTIVEGSDLATITNEGVLTVSKAGTIRVSASVEDEGGNTWTTSATLGYVNIIPTIELNANTLGVGKQVALNATFNCDVPTGSEVKYEIVNGNNFATLTENVLSGASVGDVIIRVTFAEGAAYSTYADFEVEIFTAELVIPNVPVIYGGDTVTVDAKLSNDADFTSVEYFAVNKTGKATINALGEISPISAGTVDLYVVIDGIESVKYQIVVIPKVEVRNTQSIAVGGERYLDYWANCDLPDSETIDLTFEVMSGNELVTLDAQTGKVKANAIGEFEVIVTVTGDSFVAVSPWVEIAIENPITALSVTPNDMVVGEEQTLSVIFGKGEIEIVSSQIAVSAGAEFVQLEGLKIKAIGAGSVTFAPVINGVAGIEHTIVISNLTGVIVIGDMSTLDSQPLSMTFNSETYSPSVTYAITSGTDSAYIENGVLKSTGKPGAVTVSATVNGEVLATKTINVLAKATLGGITADQKVKPKDEITLSFTKTFEGDIESVTYELVSGEATLTENQLGEGETVADKKATLTINGTGEIKVRVIVNGHYSEIITINSEAQGGCGAAVFADIALAMLAIGVLMFVRKH